MTQHGEVPVLHFREDGVPLYNHCSSVLSDQKCSYLLVNQLCSEIILIRQGRVQTTQTHTQ